MARVVSTAAAAAEQMSISFLVPFFGRVNRSGQFESSLVVGQLTHFPASMSSLNFF